jgi:hypothetical protein
MNLLLLPPKYWDNRHVSPHPAFKNILYSPTQFTDEKTKAWGGDISKVTLSILVGKNQNCVPCFLVLPLPCDIWDADVCIGLWVLTSVFTSVFSTEKPFRWSVEPSTWCWEPWDGCWQAERCRGKCRTLEKRSPTVSWNTCLLGFPTSAKG